MVWKNEKSKFQTNFPLEIRIHKILNIPEISEFIWFWLIPLQKGKFMQRNVEISFGETGCTSCRSMAVKCAFYRTNVYPRSTMCQPFFALMLLLLRKYKCSFFWLFFSVLFLLGWEWESDTNRMLFIALYFFHLTVFVYIQHEFL